MGTIKFFYDLKSGSIKAYFPYHIFSVAILLSEGKWAGYTIHRIIYIVSNAMVSNEILVVIEVECILVLQDLLSNLEKLYQSLRYRGASGPIVSHCFSSNLLLQIRIANEVCWPLSQMTPCNCNIFRGMKTILGR